MPRLQNPNIRYPDNDGDGQARCFDDDVPAEYINQGFSQDETDLLIFVSVFNENSGVIAYAGPCVTGNWPYYGITGFNAQQVKTNLSQTGFFHASIETTVHFEAYSDP